MQKHMECDLLYFAYGPNLNADDLRQWCQGHNHPYPLGERVADAYLPDTRLVFNNYSRSRKGGLLNIRYQVGQVTPGVLFKVIPGGWAVLDTKAISEHMYKHLDIITLTDDGAEHVAVAYHFDSASTSGEFVEPSPAYLEIVREGLRTHGIDDSFLDMLARGKTPPHMIDQLFVYSTFMTGGPRHSLLTRWVDPSFKSDAVVPGLLYDSGKGFPCMIPDATGQHLVTGELFILKDFKRAFERLDYLEMTNRHRTTNIFFRRAIVRATKPDGTTCLAWSYVADSSVEEMEPVPSGSWRSVSG